MKLWSWSPPELNRIAYVDKKRRSVDRARRRAGSAADADAANFTLPAWSDDGRLIAVAERKNGGKKWEISVVTLPPRLIQ